MKHIKISHETARHSKEGVDTDKKERQEGRKRKSGGLEHRRKKKTPGDGNAFNDEKKGNRIVAITKERGQVGEKNRFIHIKKEKGKREEKQHFRKSDEASF